MHTQGDAKLVQEGAFFFFSSKTHSVFYHGRVQDLLLQ